ncbi:hypothetical protein LV564_04980 [Komagataeibacter nataicola]|nr:MULTISPECIES: hypothetical protein [Komagataeibacter]WEQ56442.1 hypothetical protein LV564_04980 [Komagataeibacter nataicola]
MPGNLMFILWRVLGFGDDPQLRDRLVRVETKVESTETDLRALRGEVRDLSTEMRECMGQLIGGMKALRQIGAAIVGLITVIGTIAAALFAYPPFCDWFGQLLHGGHP